MKKRNYKLAVYSVILLVLIAVAALLYFYGLSGKPLFSPSETVVSRSYSLNGSDVLVSLTISSSANVLALQENFSESCSVKDYSLSENYSIFSFKPDENIWIVADNTREISAVLSYTLDSSCSIVSGRFTEDGENWQDTIGAAYIYSPEAPAGNVSAGTGNAGANSGTSGSGGGGSGGGSAGTSGGSLGNTNSASNNASKIQNPGNLAGENVEIPKRVSILWVVFVILIIVAIILVALIIFEVHRRYAQKI